MSLWFQSLLLLPTGHVELLGIKLIDPSVRRREDKRKIKMREGDEKP